MRTIEELNLILESGDISSLTDDEMNLLLDKSFNEDQEVFGR